MSNVFYPDSSVKHYKVKLDTSKMRDMLFNGESYTPHEVVVLATSQEEAAEKALKANPGWLIYNDDIYESVSLFNVIV